MTRPTTEELVKLKEYLEGALKFKREAQRFRKAHKLHNVWIDGKIDEAIKMDTLRLACLDQVLAEGAS